MLLGIYGVEVCQLHEPFGCMSKVITETQNQTVFGLGLEWGVFLGDTSN
jgi:hypothetical protein